MQIIRFVREGISSFTFQVVLSVYKSTFVVERVRPSNNSILDTPTSVQSLEQMLS
jgi:hypothetical protein